MKVNMTPNPLDVVTIHASQGDTEAREWEFELHNNGELIDTSEITEQLFFKAYKGGTEQILPENGSVPTTAPFLGDIRYPQGLLSEQEFLYRQSPTESDGLAKITDIKGNTLVWNQLVQNGDFASTSMWSVNNITTYSVANNILTFSFSSNDGFIGPAGIPLTKNHKYLWLMDFKTDLPSPYRENIKLQNYRNGSWSIANRVSNNNWNTYSTIFTFTENSATVTAPLFRLVSYTDGAIAISNSNQIRNVQVFDLTQMGLDISSPSDFTSLFPLSYYDYNQGSLLSFNGNGIKTVGFNLFDQDSVLTNVGFVKQSDGSFYIQYPSTANFKVLFENKLKYSGQFFLVYKFKYASTTSQGCRFEVHYTDGTVDQIYADGSNDFVEISFISRAGRVVDYINVTYGSNVATWWKDVCINISDPSKNGTYEPYTSSTLSLPISTYFPNGMKSAGNVYDELTENKAITRIGSVDLGTLIYTYESPTSSMITVIPNLKMTTSDSIPINAIMAEAQTISADQRVSVTGKRIYSFGNSPTILFRDFGYTDVNAFKQAMSGQYLFFELNTPTEESITTASLVTENGEIPLSNEDGTLIGKCTEQLSENPGFIDAKIKLSDSDGECYSNKIQLHIERSPQ